MRHFTYKHMPAYGLGESDPFRPRVTGGIGHAINIILITDFVTGTVTLKWFYGDPEETWALLIGESSYNIGSELQQIWNISQATVEDQAGQRPVWSTIVGGTLWSVWEPTVKWRTELVEDNSSFLSSKWDMAMVDEGTDLGKVSS